MALETPLKIMVSSTYLDLTAHRDVAIKVISQYGCVPLAQEFDSALAHTDLIDASLKKVEAADLYIGLIGPRYGTRFECQERNAKRLSLTELEYWHAAERGLPCLFFIVSPNHKFTMEEMDKAKAEGTEAHALRKAFIEQVQKTNTWAEFSSVENLENKVITSIVGLLMSNRGTSSPAANPADLSVGDDTPPIAAPALYPVRKGYVEKKFFGREKELALIDRWSTGPTPILLFQAIGGMGKSMLTWHWLKHRANGARRDWAGQLWYSFYEQGADLNDFCVHALAYTTGAPPGKFRGNNTVDLARHLCRELDNRPWLLILDGLERILFYYARPVSSSSNDPTRNDELGLDRHPKDCFRRGDDEVLTMLAQVSRSKMLVSTRLTPAALTDTTTRLIAGVEDFSLEGLEPEDAEQVLRNAGVRGSSPLIRRYMSVNFACHPLSVGVVAGHVLKHLDALGDFDRWSRHAKGGGDRALVNKDLRGRQNHILARAFNDLDADSRALLGAISVGAALTLTPEIVRLLNPMKPVKAPEQGAYIAVAVDGRSQAEIYSDAYAQWERDVVTADYWLESALPDLTERGLLQYDFEVGAIDMHPVIRQTVQANLTETAKARMGSHVFDALQSREKTIAGMADTREELVLTTTLVNALSSAGKIGESAMLLEKSNLEGALLRLWYFAEYLDIVQPYFPNGFDSNADTWPRDLRRGIIRNVGRCLHGIGEYDLSLRVQINEISRYLRRGPMVSGYKDDTDLSLGLYQLGESFLAKGDDDQARHLFELAGKLAGSINRSLGAINTSVYVQLANVDFALGRGDLDQAEALMGPLRKLLQTRASPKDPVEPGARPSITLGESRIIRLVVELAFRRRKLDEALAEHALKVTRAMADRYEIVRTKFIVALWYQTKGLHIPAIELFDDIIGLANDCGTISPLEFEARRAISLLAMGRSHEAQRIAARISDMAPCPHSALARLFQLLFFAAKDDEDKVLAHAKESYREKAEAHRQKAEKHVIDGYRMAGRHPPHDHWAMMECKGVVTAMELREPRLPARATPKILALGFEADIQRLIDDAGRQRPN